MKFTLKTCIALAVFVFLFPALTLAAGKTEVITDKESDMPATFKRAEVLPGNINVEFSMVTLEKYKKEVNDVFDYTFSETKKIAELFNTNDPQSDLGRIAASAGTAPVKVSKETIVLAEHAKEIAEWTLGTFDPVSGPGNYKSLKIDKKNSTIHLTKPGLSLELKGILEGFMADLFIRASYHANLDDAFVRVNGVCRAMGKDAFGPWRIMVEGNGEKKAKRGMSVTLGNYAAATVGGEHPAPTVNPRNGKPVNSPFYSVTVITKQAATAEGVATSIYISGPTEGENLINALGIRAIFAYNDGGIKKVGRW